MGHTRRGSIKPVNLGVILASTLVLALASAGCSGDSPSVEEQLLSATDFPEFAQSPMVASGFESTVTLLGQPTAQILLSGPGFALSESIVRFGSNQEAIAYLAAIKQDQVGQSTALPGSGKFQDVSGILTEHRGEDQSLTLFFVEDESLVRITITGTGASSLLPRIAENARSKLE